MPPPRRPARSAALAVAPSGRRPAVPPGDPVRRLRAWRLILLIVLTIVAGRTSSTCRPSRVRPWRLLRQGPAAPSRRPPCGDITDINGVPLATTVRARNVTADQTLVKDPAAEAAALAEGSRRRRRGQRGASPASAGSYTWPGHHAAGVGPGRGPELPASSARSPRRASTPRRLPRRPTSSASSRRRQGRLGPRVRLQPGLAGTPGTGGLPGVGARYAIPTADSSGTDRSRSRREAPRSTASVQYVAQAAIAAQVKAAR